MGLEKRRVHKLLDQLREHQRTLGLIRRYSAIGTWQLDLASGQIIWSQDCRALLGIPSEVQPSRSAFLEVVHPEDRTRIIQTARAAAALVAAGSCEFRVIRPDGEIRNLHTAWRTQARGDQMSSASGILRDVTEDHRSATARQRALSQAPPAGPYDAATAGQFRHFIDGAPVAILLSDPDGNCTYANAAWLALTGLPMEQALGVGWIAAIHIDDRERVMNAWEALRTGTRLLDLEFRCLHRDGDVRNVHVRGAAVRDAQGTLIGYASAEIDITEGQQQRAAQDRFNGRVRALAQRLEDQRERERRELAETLHAGLRRELGTVRAELQRLQALESDGAPLRGALQALLVKLEGSVEWVRGIAFELHPSGVEDLGFKGAVERRAHEVAAAAGFDVTVAVPISMPNVEQRRLLVLYRVLQEALQNIVRHARARRVQVSVTDQDSEIRLRVTDDGVGLQSGDRFKPGCLGLLAASERLAQIGGHSARHGSPRWRHRTRGVHSAASVVDAVPTGTHHVSCHPALARDSAEHRQRDPPVCQHRMHAAPGATARLRS